MFFVVVMNDEQCDNVYEARLFLKSNSSPSIFEMPDLNFVILVSHPEIFESILEIVVDFSHDIHCTFLTGTR